MLLDLADASIRHGLEQQSALSVDSTRYPQSLQTHLASFVTLYKHAQLRGCIGALQAREPLVCDVARHAYAAAFQDPRFPPLAPAELSLLALHISILSAPYPLTFSDEPDIIRQLRPGVDGLIIEDGFRRGTFLPSVWESLPEPTQFWQQLKRKAGLPLDYWSSTLRVQRYTTESFTR